MADVTWWEFWLVCRKTESKRTNLFDDEQEHEAQETRAEIDPFRESRIGSGEVGCQRHRTIRHTARLLVDIGRLSTLDVVVNIGRWTVKVRRLLLYDAQLSFRREGGETSDEFGVVGAEAGSG